MAQVAITKQLARIEKELTRGQNALSNAHKHMTNLKESCATPTTLKGQPPAGIAPARTRR